MCPCALLRCTPPHTASVTVPLCLVPLMQVMGRPSWIPVPDFALATLLGEGASVVLEGQRVVPTRAQDAGFKFKYPQVRDALKAVIRRP